MLNAVMQSAVMLNVVAPTNVFPKMHCAGKKLGHPYRLMGQSFLQACTFFTVNQAWARSVNEDNQMRSSGTEQLEISGFTRRDEFLNSH
jgi:hypothetical protein